MYFLPGVVEQPSKASMLGSLAGERSRSCDGWLLFDGLLVLSSYVERVIELMSGEPRPEVALAMKVPWP